MLAQAVKPRQTELVTQKEVTTALCNCTKAFISNICWFRQVFEESCFARKDYMETPIFLLKSEDCQDEVVTLSRWLSGGVCEAIKKRYVRSIVFALNEAEAAGGVGRLLEQWILKYNFDGNQVEIERSGGIGDHQSRRTRFEYKEDFKQKFNYIVRSISALSLTLPQLPARRVLTMYMVKTDDAPAEYSPQYFIPLRETSRLKFEDEGVVSIDCGKARLPVGNIGNTSVGL